MLINTRLILSKVSPCDDMNQRPGPGDISRAACPALCPCLLHRQPGVVPAAVPEGPEVALPGADPVGEFPPQVGQGVVVPRAVGRRVGVPQAAGRRAGVPRQVVSQVEVPGVSGQAPVRLPVRVPAVGCQLRAWRVPQPPQVRLRPPVPPLRFAPLRRRRAPGAARVWALQFRPRAVRASVRRLVPARRWAPPLGCRRLPSSPHLSWWPALPRTSAAAPPCQARP